MIDLVEEHRIKVFDMATRLTGDIHKILGRAPEEEGGEAADALYLVTATLKRVPSDNEVEPVARDLAQSVIDLAMEAGEAGDVLVPWICESVEFWSGRGRSSETCICSFSCFDLPGSEEGWPRAREVPRHNALFIVPKFLGRSFVEYVSGPALRSDYNFELYTVGEVEVQEVESSEAGVAAAVDHVLKFPRTLASTLFPEELTTYMYADSIN